jgi:4-amino-4-deoxy-L-arabinose transferase-like glycosyltransferase
VRHSKDLWLPCLILVTSSLLFSALLPFFPVDETRYLSVAWEMNLHDSFIVPLQNGLPYSHKPPLLFWLVNLDWLIFGVNEGSLRLIPMLFSLINIGLIHRIAILMWNDEKIARYAALMLASTLSYLLWSSLIMFDLVLTTWVLLGLLGLLLAGKTDGFRPWLMVGVAIGGGILTKGPALFVYLLPVALLSRLWLPKQRFTWRWYVRLALAFLIGIAIVLAWLLPAALTGGDAYREAILWGQTVNRVANSFAHKRPIWWYLPWLPVLLMPWILLPPAWRLRSHVNNDYGSRFAFIWGGGTLLIFSLISGKQFHYLIPALPAFVLIMARNLAACSAGMKTAPWRHAVAVFYLILAAVAFALPFTKAANAVAKAGITGLSTLAYALLAIGILLLAVRVRSTGTLITSTAVASLALCAVVFAGDAPFFSRYDLRGIAHEIKLRQEQGYSIVHLGKYHGQYQFLGRLPQPLVVVSSLDEVAKYAAQHDKVALITYEKNNTAPDPGNVLFQQPFKSRKVVLWNRKGIEGLLQGGERQALAQPIDPS